MKYTDKRPVSIAPMMEWTDRHYRSFMRQITRHTMLYTEMKTTGAVIHGDHERIIGFSEPEHPLVLQVGGDDPAELAQSAKIAEEWGYDEVNINVGCPSNRVQKGNFGACLMAQPEVVGAGVAAMQEAVKIPVTVKHRIGIDDLERYEDMANFVDIVSRYGCERFIVHSRIALLQGLDPKGNRTIPPLRYEDVYRLKREFPHLIIEINGGIKTIEDMQMHLQHVDGVMLGRAAYENPFLFSAVDATFYNDERQPPSRREIIARTIEYIDKVAEAGVFPNKVIRHMHGLFHFKPGTRAWKRYLSENAYKPGTTGKILWDAVEKIPDEILDERPAIFMESDTARNESA